MQAPWLSALNDLNEETFRKEQEKKMKRQQEGKSKKVKGAGKFNFSKKQQDTENQQLKQEVKKES